MNLRFMAAATVAKTATATTAATDKQHVVGGWVS